MTVLRCDGQECLSHRLIRYHPRRVAFHLGKPILVMSILAVVAGIATRLTRRDDTRADHEHWAFSEQHWKNSVLPLAANAESLASRFARESGKTVDVKLIQNRAMNTRLSSLFMSGTGWPDLPDTVDIEIGSVGRFFRPPVDEIGLLPLNDLIAKHGWSGRILANRLATWSKDGVIFGIPLDVHPVAVLYNDALFKEAGIDLATSQTWDEFNANCLRFQDYWHAHGQPRRWAFEMAESNCGTLLQMLLERGVNVIDAKGEIQFGDDRLLNTLVTYCLMLSGPTRIGVSTPPGNESISQDLAGGFVNAMLCPDWRAKYTVQYGGAVLAGKVKLMPIPAWRDSPYRTSTYGGTMVGIPRKARDPEASWRYIESMYLSPEAIRVRTSSSYVLPPIPAAWSNPAYDAPDPFFSGQPLRRIYANLAAQVPPRYVSPASTIAENELSVVLINALRYARSHGDVGLREYCRSLLASSAQQLKRQIDHGSFDK